MGEIRSSWEIAWEKADKLGELSPEERRKQREDRCLPIGKALAGKCLGEYDSRYLEAELDKYEGEDKELIRQIILRQLVEWISLRNSSLLDEIYQGILGLTDTEKTMKVLDRIKELFRDCQKAEMVERQEIENAGRETLHQQRISGTAIKKINIRAREEWQRRLDEVAHPFEEDLNSLKLKLLG